jgi:hypothetical protein
MPLLRAKEISFPIKKAKISIALCEHRLADDLERAKAASPELTRVLYWGTQDPDSLDVMMADASSDFDAVDTAADDVCLIWYQSTFPLDRTVRAWLAPQRSRRVVIPILRDCAKPKSAASANLHLLCQRFDRRGSASLKHCLERGLRCPPCNTR